MEGELYDIMKNFIDDNKISCPESIQQSDRISVELYELVEKLCEVVGYYETETQSYEE